MTTHALFDLSGRVAIVTGGNGGIGRGIALGFAQAGAAVAIFGRNEDKNAKVVAELNEAGADATAVNIDLTDRASLEPAVRHVEAELGPPDILVNNAGIVSLSGGILEETPESWDEVIETQLTSVFLLSKLAAASMATRQRGKIINIGSMYSVLRLGDHSVVQRRQGRNRPAHQVDGDRARTARHPGERDRARLDRDRHDGTRAIGGVQGDARRDHGADTGGTLGPARGDGRPRRLSRVLGIGLRDRRDDSRRRGLRDSLRATVGGAGRSSDDLAVRRTLGRLPNFGFLGARSESTGRAVRLNPPHWGPGHPINRAHCAVSVYCWNITTLSP